MPFTPFHFGLGLAAKALMPRLILSLFVILQVITDLESLYNLVYARYPVHRFLHTFAGATLLASLASVLVLAVTLRLRDRSGLQGPPAGRVLKTLLATSLFATWSHVILDSIMHRDVAPFWPLSHFNPFLQVVGVGTLHFACLVLGFFGTVGIVFQWALREKQ